MIFSRTSCRFVLVQTSPGGRVYQKQIFDDRRQIIGIRLTVRHLHFSGTYKCVMYTMYGTTEKAVHVSVVDSLESGGSGTGIFLFGIFCFILCSFE